MTGTGSRDSLNALADASSRGFPALALNSSSSTHGSSRTSACGTRRSPPTTTPSPRGPSFRRISWRHPSLRRLEAVVGDSSSYPTEDALGIYVEPRHDRIHGWIAELYREPGFGSFDSCTYFLFYQWHGLVEAWRQRWVDAHHPGRGRVRPAPSGVGRIRGSSVSSFEDAVAQAIAANPRQTDIRLLEVADLSVEEGGFVGRRQYHVELAERFAEGVPSEQTAAPSGS